MIQRYITTSLYELIETIKEELEPGEERLLQKRRYSEQHCGHYHRFIRGFGIFATGSGVYGCRA